MNFNYGNGNIHWMDTPAQRIRALRKAKKLSQNQLADLIGVDQSTISDIENEKGLSAENMMRLCDALDATPRLIMRGESGAEDVLQQVKALVSAANVSSGVKNDRAEKPLPQQNETPHRMKQTGKQKYGPALTAAFEAAEGGRDASSKLGGLPKPRGKSRDKGIGRIK